MLKVKNIKHMEIKRVFLVYRGHLNKKYYGEWLVGKVKFTHIIKGRKMLKIKNNEIRRILLTYKKHLNMGEYINLFLIMTNEKYIHTNVLIEKRK